jgi:hypothetical protein
VTMAGLTPTTATSNAIDARHSRAYVTARPLALQPGGGLV